MPRPRLRPSWTCPIRSGVAIDMAASSSSSENFANSTSPASAFRPARPCSSERMAFCTDSVNVRPIAMTSPTDCIRVVSCAGTSGNFSNAHRGILVTT